MWARKSTSEQQRRRKKYLDVDIHICYQDVKKKTIQQSWVHVSWAANEAELERVPIEPNALLGK